MPRIARRVDLPAALVSLANQPGSLPLRLRADILNARLAHDLQSRTRDVERRNIRRAIHEFVSRCAIASATNLKGKRVFVSHPSGKSRFKLFSQIRTHVEICGAGTAAKPLKNSAADEIDIQGLHIEGNRSEGLERVEQHIGTNFVRAVDDNFCVLNVSTAKDHV